MVTSNEIRQIFLEYFQTHGHEIVASSPLVPGNDPTLLFTNAGMVQFKDVFLGTDKRAYNRAVTSQRCVRAGGKHNDLENVGYTARHHTFFEMLGNFSFGDYFKSEAIGFAWRLLTEGFELPKDKLWVTVYEDDDEAAELWATEIGVPRDRIIRCGEKDNFWSMGDTGPCGPCSEIFYDHGPDVAGGPPGSPDEDGDRYIEIWNLVFMQYDRAADGTLTPLPKPSVDTGMGLERLAAVLQGVHSNYEIDLFRNLIKAVADVTKAPNLSDQSLRVIADHIRSCAFLVVDGVVPSNEGRGYVLRRIMRRAVRHGHKLGVREPFFHRLVKYLDQEMGDAYPELRDRVDIVERVLRQEEERFAETLDHGLRMFEQATAGLESGAMIDGEAVFRLYDTYGFPIDLTADLARERGYSIDEAGFNVAMDAQRAQARAASRFGAEQADSLQTDTVTEFTGYQTLDDKVEVAAIFVDGNRVESLSAEESGLIITNRSPFYSESGGQVGDVGELSAAAVKVKVKDTQRYDGAIAHVGVVTDGKLEVGTVLDASVDERARGSTARNHSATHLLHAALRQTLGEHVQQKGSLVAPDRLRFDFSHFEPVSDEQLSEIEKQVNQWIMFNADVSTEVMPIDTAKERGAIALFGEKYDDDVRVLSIGDVSMELCGGTHVSRAGDIGIFKIVSETGVAAGVRRLEAITGNAALDWLRAIDSREARIAGLIKSDREGLEDKVEQLLKRSRELEKVVESMKSRLAANHGDELIAGAVEIDGFKVLAARCDDIDAKALRETLDQTKNKLGSAIIVLASVSDDKISLVAGVTPDGIDKIKAGPLINFVATQVGGKGGGRPEMAQAGGDQPENLDRALSSVPDWVREQLQS
ncbi:MAG: alanine--tRNA ligase [Gammaproteobacteria bacterium]|nr:alanine--tRNA ligase [Gammaproteobacteria bacterium]